MMGRWPKGRTGNSLGPYPKNHIGRTTGAVVGNGWGRSKLLTLPKCLLGGIILDDRTNQLIPTRTKTLYHYPIMILPKITTPPTKILICPTNGSSILSA